MDNSNQPWIHKYKPNTLEHLEAHKEAVRSLKLFINNFKKERKKAVLIHGPSGCGKTAAAHALANDLNIEIIEINASDVRNEKAISSLLGNVTKQQSLFSKGKIILVDEIDGVSGKKDRGGINALVSIIKTTGFPIIMTAQNPYDKKFNKLRTASTLIQFEPLDYMSVFNILKRISREEDIKHNDTDVKVLSRYIGGDARAAINDLQTLTQSKKELTRKDIDTLAQRFQTESILKALVKVFKVTDPQIAQRAFDNINEDFDQTMLWLDENLPTEYKDPEDLARAYDCLSRADVFRGRIRRWQYWRFLVYMKNMMTSGVALSKRQKYPGFTSYKPTQRILTLWKAKMKYMKRKAIAKKIAEKTHSSSKEVIQNTLPFIKEMIKQDQKMASELEEYFDLDKDEVMWMKR